MVMLQFMLYTVHSITVIGCINYIAVSGGGWYTDMERRLASGRPQAGMRTGTRQAEVPAHAAVVAPPIMTSPGVSHTCFGRWNNHTFTGCGLHNHVT